MGPAGDFAERISGRNRNSHRRNHSGFHDAQGKQGRTESTDQRLQCLSEFGTLKVLRSDVVSEQGSRGENGRDRRYRGHVIAIG